MQPVSQICSQLLQREAGTGHMLLPAVPYVLGSDSQRWRSQRCGDLGLHARLLAWTQCIASAQMTISLTLMLDLGQQLLFWFLCNKLLISIINNLHNSSRIIPWLLFSADLWYPSRILCLKLPIWSLKLRVHGFAIMVLFKFLKLVFNKESFKHCKMCRC